MARKPNDFKDNHAVNGKPLTRGERANLCTRTIVGGPKGTKAVLMVLDQFSGPNPDCWPDMGLIIRCAEASERTVQRAIKHLVDEGLLYYEDEELGKHSRVYWIQYPALAARYAEQEAADREAHKPRRGRPPGKYPRQADTTISENGVSGSHKYPRQADATPRQADTHNKQTTVSVETNNNTAVGVFCPPGSGDAKQAAQRIRNVALAQDRLIGAGVWKTQIARLIGIAGAENGGNPLPRIIEVCERAEAKGHGGAWVKTAIEEGWQFKAKRRRS